MIFTISINTMPWTPFPVPVNWYALAAMDLRFSRAMRSRLLRFSATSGFEGSSVSSEVSSSLSSVSLSSSRSFVGVCAMSSSSSPAEMIALNFWYVSCGAAIGFDGS